MEWYWRKRPKCLERNLSQCHSALHKSQMDWPEFEPEPWRWEASTLARPLDTVYLPVFRIQMAAQCFDYKVGLPPQIKRKHMPRFVRAALDFWARVLPVLRYRRADSDRGPTDCLPYSVLPLSTFVNYSFCLSIALQVGRSRVRFQMVSLTSFRPYYGPGDDSL